MVVSDETRVTGDIGGQPKITYWTPDGRVLRNLPDWHEYSRTDANGRLVETRMRDVNLDKGWLTTKPEILKLYCEGCDKWHNTQDEVNGCISQKTTKTREWEKKAKAKMKSGDDISQRMDKLESMFSQILEKLGGK